MNVIVSSRLIREQIESKMYKGNMNKLIRDATRGQNVVSPDIDEIDEMEGKYRGIMDASSAEETLSRLKPRSITGISGGNESVA